MPVLRYFVVMGCCLLGLLFAVDYLTPRQAPAAKAETPGVSSGGGSLASWRQSQERLDKSQAATPVVYPAIAPLPPTAERLRWEQQLTIRKPESADEPTLQARAELPATAAEAIAPSPPAPKPAAKPVSRPKSVARAERHDRPNYAAAYPAAPGPHYGGYRQAQFDRPSYGPSAGGFFGFRMF